MSGANLRDALFANERVWVDEIDELLQNLDADVLGGSWVVNDGVYDEGEMWHPTTSENYSPSNRRFGASRSVQFSYQSSCRSTKWFDYTSHFWVRYGTFTWDGRRSTETNQYGPREEGPSGFEETVDLGQDVYTIDGYLVDSLTTPSVEKAVEHVKSQLEKVEERIKFNLDIEAAYGCVGSGVHSVDDISEIDDITDVSHSCPVRVSGAGDKSVECQSKYFGFYSNILLYPPSDAGIGTTSAYGHDPSDEQIYENVNRAVSKYFELRDAGKTRSSLEPEDVVNYPKQRRRSLSSHGGNHISSGSDKSEIIPIGCRLGDEDVKKNKLGIHGSTILYSRSDGCWEIVNCADKDESLIIALGTEEYEVTMLDMEDDNGDSEFRRSSSFTNDAIDVLLDIVAVRNGDSTEADEVVTNERLVSDVQSFVSEPTDWRPSLLNAYCTNKGYSTEKDAHTAYLMSCIPKTFLDDSWSYKYKEYDEQLVLKYIPEELTSWNKAVNEISVSLNDGVCTISTAFSEDSTFYSVSKMINELESRIEVVEEMVRGNQFVEKIHTVYQDGNQNVEYSNVVEAESTEILSDIGGVGTRTIKSIAEEYGTYTSLAETDDSLSEYDNHHLKKETAFISDYTSQFINVYGDLYIPLDSDYPSGFDSSPVFVSF